MQWRLEEVEEELQQPDIWSNASRSAELNRECIRLKERLGALHHLNDSVKQAQEWLELYESEPQTDYLFQAEEQLTSVQKTLEELEFQRMFSGEMDTHNAFLEIQSGSGGTEAQDWAQMLERMYLRWLERKGFSVEIVDESPGEVAGIKGAVLKVSGEYAYGWLRTEHGVHRLVRKSPFDANHKRHTSFAAVSVTPEIDDKIEVVINPADLRIDTYRASGAGGQHVNRTDSAVRFTHLPTGIVVQSQSDRSQHRNRDLAMQQLRAKLYEFELKKRQATQDKLEDAKSDITWGNQIRSYVLDDGRVKDHRTNLESGHPESVLNGQLDAFVEASLKAGLNHPSEE